LSKERIQYKNKGNHEIYHFPYNTISLSGSFSSAGLRKPTLSYLKCTDADYTSTFQNVNVNPFRSPHISCAEETVGAVMKHHCTFGGKEEDVPDDFVENCKAINGKLAYVTYNYEGVCGPNQLVSGDKLPICVPNKCLEDDWVPIFIQKKKKSYA
jgi:hypothetical protein